MTMFMALVLMCAAVGEPGTPQFTEMHPGGNERVTEWHWRDEKLNRDFAIVTREPPAGSKTQARFVLYEVTPIGGYPIRIKVKLRRISSKSHLDREGAWGEFLSYWQRECIAGHVRVPTAQELRLMKLSDHGGMF